MGLNLIRSAFWSYVLTAVIITSCIASDDLLTFDDKLLLTLLSPSKTTNGEELFEGDILTVQLDFDEDNDIVGRKALPNKGGIWPDAVIAYEFHQSVSQNTTKIIEQAMQEWEKRTCIHFVPRSTQRNYLIFRTDGDGCYTFVGRKYSGGQDVNLGEGCQHLQIALHEIGHSLGFFHEHSRRDRTANLKILWHNIARGMTPQFQTGNDSPRGVPYDVTSIMHYSPMSFSSRIFERNTMVSLDAHLQPLIGTNRGITFRDAKLANLLYTCDAKCPNKASAQCKNEGYLAPYRGEPCPCVCPPNTRGEFCEVSTGSYYGTPTCGGDITDERMIQTPGYPTRSKEGGSCVWIIQAPSGKQVEVEFLDFSFRPRMDKPSSRYNGFCVFEHVEIRTRNADDGDLYCGTDIEPGTKLVSTSNQFFIILKADATAQGRGLKAKINFV